MKTLFTCRESH